MRPLSSLSSSDTFRWLGHIAPLGIWTVSHPHSGLYPCSTVTFSRAISNLDRSHGAHHVSSAKPIHVRTYVSGIERGVRVSTIGWGHALRGAYSVELQKCFAAAAVGCVEPAVI